MGRGWPRTPGSAGGKLEAQGAGMEDGGCLEHGAWRELRFSQGILISFSWPLKYWQFWDYFFFQI